MASCDVLDVANENDCPKNRGEALAFFLSRSQNSSAAELRPPTQHRSNRRQKRESRISQHIQLFETRGTTTAAPASRPGSSMSVSLMATSLAGSETAVTDLAVREPLYVNLESGNGGPARPAAGGPVVRKKPVPNPRKSLLQPVVENVDVIPLSPRRPTPLSPRPPRPAPLSPEAPQVPATREPQLLLDPEKRRTMVNNLPHLVLSSPPPLPETAPPVRKLTNPSTCSRSDILPVRHDVPSSSRTPVTAGDATPLPESRTPVRDLDFLRHLNEITDNQRKCMTLPTNTPRPIFGSKSPSPSFSNLLNVPLPPSAEETPHPSRRPLPEPPTADDENYSDASGEPIYQELSEVSSGFSSTRQSTPLVRQAVLRRNRRAAGHFRSLRGPPVEFEVAPRASSFTTADLVGLPPTGGTRAGRTHLHPHSSSCSSVSLTESDSGVSLELESMRDDMSIQGMRAPGLHWSPSEFQKVVEKMKGFQCRSESLNTNDSRVKPTPKMLHDKTRRHTLPLSLLSATVSDDEEDDGDRCSVDKMMAEITACYPARGLWYQQPAVSESGILQQLTDGDRKIQEAIFEIICSEATHLRNLTVLINVFKNAPEFACAAKSASSELALSLAVVSMHEEQNLFLNIVDVRNASATLLRDLHERCLKRHAETGFPTMPDFSDVLECFAVNQAKVYVKYCSDQLFQEKTLNGLKERKRFQEVVRRLESQKICEQLDFRSYLMLPMQRITRLPLLISAVLKRYEVDSPGYTGYNNALLAMNKVVRECDEGAKRANCIDELCRINALLQWMDTAVKKIPIISAARSLVKRGNIDVIQIEHKFLPRRTFHKKSMHLLVFNDLFMLTKPKSGSEEALVVIDYCQRNLLDCLPVTPTERDDLLAHTSISAIFTPDTFRGVKLVLLRNSAQKTVEFFLVMTLESDYMRWLSVFNPSETLEGDEKIYEIWDCPQYEVLADYAANENDELNVSVGDVIDVYRKSSDGWIEGRRMSDGHRGWLPTGVAKEIMTEHARARHLKERNRLLAASAEIMKERQK